VGTVLIDNFSPDKKLSNNNNLHQSDLYGRLRRKYSNRKAENCNNHKAAER
jgi:hypothetical protein